MTYGIYLLKYNYSVMKPNQKVKKSPYNPQLKLRAEILPEKFPNPKPESSSDQESSNYDSEV